MKRFEENQFLRFLGNGVIVFKTTIQCLFQIFETADEDGGGGLDMEEFRNAMRTQLGTRITDAELDRIFMKVDTNCDGTVDWDEYLTYMLLECRGQDTMSVQVSLVFYLVFFFLFVVSKIITTLTDTVLVKSKPNWYHHVTL